MTLTLNRRNTKGTKKSRTKNTSAVASTPGDAQAWYVVSLAFLRFLGFPSVQSPLAFAADG